MSFGVSASDIAIVVRLAVRVYLNYTKSAHEFEELAQDIDSFKTVLKQAELVLIQNRPNAQLSEGLKKLKSRSEDLLKALDDFCNKHASLGSSEQRKRDKLRWSPSSADDFRKSIQEQIVIWNIYISCITM